MTPSHAGPRVHHHEPRVALIERGCAMLRCSCGTWADRTQADDLERYRTYAALWGGYRRHWIESLHPEQLKQRHYYATGLDRGRALDRAIRQAAAAGRPVRLHYHYASERCGAPREGPPCRTITPE